MSASNDYYKNLAAKYFAPAPSSSIASQPVVLPTAPAQPIAPTPGITPEPAPEPQEDKQSNVEKFFGGIGKVVDVGGDILDLSGKYLARPTLGVLSKGIASDAVQGTLDKVGIESLSEETAQKIQDADSFTEAWRERADDLSWWEQMLAETLADPTTYATAGAVAAASKVRPVARLAASNPEVARFLMQAENAVGLAERIQAIPLTAPIAGVKKLTKGVDLLNRKVDPQAINPITGAKIGTGLLDQTKKSVLQESVGQVDAALRSAWNEGVNTIGGRQGEIGITRSGGIDELINSNRVRGAQTTAADIRARAGVGPLSPAQNAGIRADIRKLGTAELADLYDGLPPTHELKTFVEDQMKNKGLLTTRTVQVPTGKGKNKGFTTQTVIDIDRNKIDASRTSRDRMLNTPGVQGARPAVTGKIDDDLDSVFQFIRHDAGVPRGTTPTRNEFFVKENLKTLLNNNSDRINAASLYNHTGVREDLIRATTAATEQEARTHLATAYKRINANESARGLVHPWASRIVDKFIPQIQKTTDDIDIPAFNQYAINNSVVDDKHMAALRALYDDDGVKQAQKRWEKDVNEVGQIFNKTPGLTMRDSLTAQEIHDARRLIADPNDLKRVDKFLKDWNLAEETFTQDYKKIRNRIARVPGGRTAESYSLRDAYTDVVVEKWAKNTATRMGIENAKADPALLGKLAWVPKAWREQALISPRYLAVNALDMGVKSAIYGVNGIENRGARKTAQKLGVGNVPREVFVGNETRDINNLFNNGAEFMSTTERSALPGPLGAISKMNRGLARGLENSFREWAWDNGLKDGLHAYKPMLHEQIRTSVRNAQGLIDDLEKTGTYRGGVNTARDSGILFSPEELHQLARKHGASTDVANQLSRSWQDGVSQASRQGIDMSNKVHFDFDKTYNLEDKLFVTKWMPFHFFASRNIPFYMETLANRPEIVNAWQSYQDISEQDRIEMGLPNRLEGMVPVGDGFLDGILGPNKVFFNPMSALSFADQTKNLGTATRENEYEAPAKFFSRRGIGEVLDRAGDLGVGGPAPWIQIPLSIVGVTSKGAKDEVSIGLRHSGLTEDYLGTDLGEGVAREFFNDARAMFHNGERVETFTGSQFKDNTIVSVLQDNMQMMIDRGTPPDIAREMYTQASKDGPGNPLWDAAQEQAESDIKERNHRNFWFPFPTKDISPQREKISVAQEAMPEGALDDDKIVDLLKHFGHPAVANRGFQRPGLVDRQGEKIWTNPDGTRQEKLPELKAGDLTKWGGPVWGPDKPYPYNNEGALNGYKMWRKNAPEDSDMPSDYFAIYNRQR